MGLLVSSDERLLHEIEFLVVIKQSICCFAGNAKDITLMPIVKFGEGLLGQSSIIISLRHQAEQQFIRRLADDHRATGDYFCFHNQSISITSSLYTLLLQIRQSVTVLTHQALSRELIS